MDTDPQDKRSKKEAKKLANAEKNQNLDDDTKRGYQEKERKEQEKQKQLEQQRKEKENQKKKQGESEKGGSKKSKPTPARPAFQIYKVWRYIEA